MKIKYQFHRTRAASEREVRFYCYRIISIEIHFLVFARHQRRLNYYAIFTWRQAAAAAAAATAVVVATTNTVSQLVMVDGRAQCAYHDNKSFASGPNHNNNNNRSFIGVFMVRLHFNCPHRRSAQWDCDAFEICVSGRDAAPHA